MTSSELPILAARIERFPIEGRFTISRGAKTEAVTVVAELGRAGLVGRGECVPYPRYGETPEATLAAIQAMQDAVAGGLDRQAQLFELLDVAANGAEVDVEPLGQLRPADAAAVLQQRQQFQHARGRSRHAHSKSR